jgi:preprotein translocase subunit SecF
VKNGGYGELEFLKPGRTIDFVSKMKVATLVSAVLIAVGLAFVIYRGGPNWGVEFVGGTEVHIKFGKPIRSEDIRSLMSKAGYPVESVQQLGLPQDNEYLLRFTPEVVGFDRIKVFQEELGKLIGANEELKGASIQRIDFIGPKIGKELIRKAFFSVLIGWVGIMLYLLIRFEFAFALGAVFALIHDVLITLGAIFVLNKEITLTIIAALLTIIGYSVNDTIVVFDRIRENLGKGLKMGFSDIVNESINQTLSRTILTVLTVLLVLVALFLLGGAVIHDFAFAMLVGVIAGTYSSIFIASSFVIFWRMRRAMAAKL